MFRHRGTPGGGREEVALDMSNRAGSSQAAVDTADAYITRLNELMREDDLRALDQDRRTRLLLALKESGPMSLKDLTTRLEVSLTDVLRLVQSALEAKSVMVEESDGEVLVRPAA